MSGIEESGFALSLGMKLSYAWRIRGYLKETDREIENLEAKLGNLNRDISNLQEDIQQRRTANWRVLWNELDIVYRNLNILANQLTSEIKESTSDLSEQGILSLTSDFVFRKLPDMPFRFLNIKNNYTALSFLSDNIESLESTVTQIRSNSIQAEAEEIQSVADYVNYLESVCKKMKEGYTNFENNIKFFEQKHEGTIIYSVERLNRIRQIQEFGRKEKKQREKDSLRRYQAFASQVATKLARKPPEYSPLGGYIPRDIKVPPEIGSDKLSAEYYDLLFPIDVKCRYEGITLTGIPSPFNMAKRAKKRSRKLNADYFLTECLVAELITEDVKYLAQTFDDSNYALFLYELETNKLMYNKNSHSANTFSNYFLPGTRPKSITELLEGQEVNSEITIKDLQDNLNFSVSETEKLIQRGTLFPLSNVEPVYALNKRGGI